MDVAGRKAPTIRLRRLATELKRLRVAAGLTQEEAAARTGLDASSFYRIERAMNRPQRRTVTTLLDLYGVTDPHRRETLLSWLRDSVLTRPTPMQLWAAIDEAAIRRKVGGRAVMRAQLLHLVEASQSSHVKLQVVPFDAGAHPGMPGSFVLMHFADQFDAPLVYSDSMAGDMFLEADDDVTRFSATFDRITKLALNPAQSKKLIKEAAAEVA